jgi:agmatinase
MKKSAILGGKIRHVDITGFDAGPIIEQYANMAFQSKNLARCAHIYDKMLKDSECTIILCLAGSLFSAGLGKMVHDLVSHCMADVTVSTGAIIVDQDFFEALGFSHYRGIHTARPIRAGRSGKVVDKMHEKVTRLLSDDKFVVVVGGNHSVSIGSVRAHTERFDDLSVLHLDAHTDMREHYEGDRFNHACTMARVRELTPHIVSVGIRSSDKTEMDAVEKAAVFYAHEIHGQKTLIQAVHRALTLHVYVTIDVDVFDTGIMPSTGTPEPGGLDWYEVTGLLKAVSEQLTVVGFDVVELIGRKNRSCDFLAAKLVYTFLSSITDKKG